MIGTYNESTRKASYVLTVDNATALDAGTYTCEAENGIETSVNSTEVVYYGA